MELGLALMVEWRELIVALTVPRPKTLDLLDGGGFFQVGPLMGKSSESPTFQEMASQKRVL